MVLSLQSCGTHCFAKGTVSALRRTQPPRAPLPKTALRRKRKPPEGGFSIQPGSLWIRRPSMLTKTSDDTP